MQPVLISNVRNRQALECESKAPLSVSQNTNLKTVSSAQAYSEPSLPAYVCPRNADKYLHPPATRLVFPASKSELVFATKPPYRAVLRIGSS